MNLSFFSRFHLLLLLFFVCVSVCKRHVLKIRGDKNLFEELFIFVYFIIKTAREEKIHEFFLHFLLHYIGRTYL